MTPDNLVPFPEEYLTQEQRERDRWSTVAFLAAVLPQFTKREEQLPFLKTALSKFADVSDDSDWARPHLAVKMLLETLVEDTDLRRGISKRASKEWFGNLLNTANQEIET
jgi:hypothetical protein